LRSRGVHHTAAQRPSASLCQLTLKAPSELPLALRWLLHRGRAPGLSVTRGVPLNACSVSASRIVWLSPTQLQVPWYGLDQFRQLDWGDVRQRVRARLALCPSRSSSPPLKRRRVGVAQAAADADGGRSEHCCGLVTAIARRSAPLHLASQDGVHEWLAASLTGGPLLVAVKEAADDGNRQHDKASEGDLPGGALVQPKIVSDEGKWLVGEIDAREVRLLHRKPPRWPKVLQYALRLEEQLAAGSPDGPPPVQISVDPRYNSWVANDGAHRLYASLVSGLPLRCRWKHRQCRWEDLSEQARARLHRKDALAR